jgi:hypothetical protein
VSNSGAIIQFGDGILNLEFQSKMNTGGDVLKLSIKD